MHRPVLFRISVLLLLALATPVIAQTKPSDEALVRMLMNKIQAVVNISTNRGAGSGFFIDAEGHVLTNAHVVAGATTRLDVLTEDGLRLKARIIAQDADVDLALLKVESKGPFPFISIDEDKLSPNMLGQTMVVIGNPRDIGTSVSRGILSARARKVDAGIREFENLLQTDAAVNPGNSGGPILDIAGQLSGVTQLKRAGSAGLSFAVDCRVARKKTLEFFEKEKKSQTQGD